MVTESLCLVYNHLYLDFVQLHYCHSPATYPATNVDKILQKVEFSPELLEVGMQ